MFTIIGGDGREYGPASAAQIRAWMAAGRANLDTKARAMGSDEWRRIGDFPEFTHTESAPPVVAAVTDATLAEREMRLFARMIDWSLQILCMLPGSIVLGAQVLTAIVQAAQTGNFDFSNADPSRIQVGALLLLGAMLLLGIVQIVLLSTRGQTIGKRILGIRIVRLDGTRVGFVRAWLLREFVPALIGIVPIIGPFLLRPLFTLVDWCFVFRDDRRCIHDFIAGTKVVKANVTVAAAPATPDAPAAP